MSGSQRNSLIVILGAGDLGTATALRLFRCGLKPVLLEKPQPADLHYIRNFSDVLYSERKTVEEITAVSVVPAPDERSVHEQITKCFADRYIPVLNRQAEGDREIIARIKPVLLIDCTTRYGKVPVLQLDWQNIPCVIRIGFRHNVGIDGHIVVGDNLQYSGRVFYKKHNVEPQINDPEYIFKAPLEGIFNTDRRIGESVFERDKIGSIGGIAILAPLAGCITGLLHSGHFVHSAQPLFELQWQHKSRETLTDIPVLCQTISGGILEAVITYLFKQEE
jgi:xanthine dehydrogenase accessory factor